MDEDVQQYVEAIPAEQRPLFDRVQGLILAAFPQARVYLSYKMPTYEVGSRRLHVGAWTHGVSLYGWDADRDGGFVERHPELSSGRGTIRIRPRDAAEISDDELTQLLRGALDE